MLVESTTITEEDTEVNSKHDQQANQIIEVPVCEEHPEPRDNHHLGSVTAIIEMSPWPTEPVQRTSNPSKTNPEETEQDDADSQEGPSNECLLGTAFVSFMGFAILEVVAAVVAGSEALMGDSAAMIVDALTYLFNLLAERKKKRFASEHVMPLTVSIYPERARRVFQRDKRKMTLQLELVPPLISATVLMMVTGVVLHEAIKVLILDSHRERSEQSDPNLNLMLGFSILNLLLDVLNVFCFANAKHLFGYETMERNNPHVPSTYRAKPLARQNHSFGDRASRNNREYVQIDTSEGSEDDFHDEQFDAMGNGHSNAHQPEHNQLEEKPMAEKESKPNDLESNGHSSLHNGESTVGEGSRTGLDNHADRRSDATASNLVADTRVESLQCPHNAKGSSTQPDSSGETDLNDERGNTNLNMCSAYTHVFADTLRSLAVIAAATIAEFFDEVTSEEADAMAAVLVSILILLSLIPLFQGWLQSYKELRAILAEEKSELMF